MPDYEPITLLQSEIEEITGLVQPTAQARWFKLNYGIATPFRGDGKISVPRKLYYQKAGIKPGERRKPQLRLSSSA